MYIKSPGGRPRHRTSEVDATPPLCLETGVPNPCGSGTSKKRAWDGAYRARPNSIPIAKKNRARELRARSMLSRLAPSVTESESAEQEEDAAQDAAHDGRARSGENLACSAGCRGCAGNPTGRRPAGRSRRRGGGRVACRAG